MRCLDTREAASHLPEQRLWTVSFLDCLPVDSDGQQQAERIAQDVALAAKDLLASVIAGRVERSPPLQTGRAYVYGTLRFRKRLMAFRTGAHGFF